MEEKKPRLQKIKEQIEKKMTRAIVEVIEQGEKVEKYPTGLYVGGVHIVHFFDDDFRCILEIKAPEISEAFKPSKIVLKERAEKLRAELEKIENDLNS